MIADAIESTADIVTSALLWVGLKWSAKPADVEHPYGHGKAEALVALGIALALCIAAFVIARESIENINTPHKTPKAFTLIILVLVILTKEVLFRYVIKTGTEINSEVVKADAFHHRSDAITSAAAFIGITIGLETAALDHEVTDDTVENGVFVVACVHVLDEVGDGDRRFLGVQLDNDVTEVGGQFDLSHGHYSFQGIRGFERLGALPVWPNCGQGAQFSVPDRNFEVVFYRLGN